MCSHKNRHKIEATKSIAGLTFKYKTEECKDCKAKLWSLQNEKDFNKWLVKQRQSEESKKSFTIQKVRISQRLLDCANSLANHFGSDLSSVFRVCLSVYYYGGNDKRDFIDEVRPINDDEVCEDLRFRVAPKLYRTIKADAELTGDNINVAAIWIIERVLTAAMAETDNQIIKDISISLAAA